MGVDSFNAVVPAFAILDAGFSDGEELRVGTREVDLSDGAGRIVARSSERSDALERIGDLAD